MCVCVHVYVSLWIYAFTTIPSSIYPAQLWETDWIPVWHMHHWQNCQLFPALRLNCPCVSWKEPRFISRFQVQFACNLLTKKVHHSSPDCHSESSIVLSSVLICINCVLLRNADHHAEQFSILLLESFSYQAMRRLLTPLCWKHIK